MISDMTGLAGILAQAAPATQSAAGAWQFLGQLGAALAIGLAAVGSSIGIGVAGQAAAGAWAKEAKAGIGQRFTYIILLGMPISQTLYAMIVMNRMRDVLAAVGKVSVEGQRIAATLARPEASFLGMMLAIGLAAGIAEMLSAWMQGKIGAAGIRALNEGEGKGFAFLLIAMGIVETVGIFAMVFLLGMLPAVKM